MQERPLALPSGGVVTVLNLVVFVKKDESGGTLSVQYRSTLPPDDSTGRLAEATEVAEIHRAFAEAQGFGVVRAQVCDSQAAAEMRALPEMTFRFERGDDGGWALRDEPQPHG